MEEGKMTYTNSPSPPVQPDSGAVDAVDSVDLAAEPKREEAINEEEGKEEGIRYKLGNYELDSELSDTPLMVPREPVYGADAGSDDIMLGKLPELLKQRFTHASDRGGVSDFISALNYHEE